jgi:hypothetical protein
LEKINACNLLITVTRILWKFQGWSRKILKVIQSLNKYFGFQENAVAPLLACSIDPLLVVLEGSKKIISKT